MKLFPFVKSLTAGACSGIGPYRTQSGNGMYYPPLTERRLTSKLFYLSSAGMTSLAAGIFFSRAELGSRAFGASSDLPEGVSGFLCPGGGL